MTDDDTLTAVHRVRTRLGELSVREIGTGPPAVLWHSMFVDSTSWCRVAPALATRRRLLLVDAPSSGRSDPLARATDIEACADAAGDLLDGLGLASVDWLGNAWGGHVGLRLAAERPERVRSLVAVSAPTHPISRGLRVKVHLLLRLYRLLGAVGPVRAAITEGLLTDHTRTADPEGLALLTGHLERADRRAMARAVQTAILHRRDLTDSALTIEAPVLFVTTDDRGEWTPAEARAVAERMPDCREVTVSGARVIPAIEQPERLADAVSAFWARVDRDDVPVNGRT